MSESAASPDPGQRRSAARKVVDGEAGDPAAVASSIERPRGDSARSSGKSRSGKRTRLDLGIAAHFEALRRERWQRTWRELRGAWPAWLVSLALHVVALVALALYALTESREAPPIELVAEWVSAQAREAAKRDAAEQAERRPAVTIESVPAASGPSRRKPAAAKAEAVKKAPVVRPPLSVDVSRMLSSRAPGEKQAILDASSGSADSEQCVLKALGWLKRVQQPDGHWQLHEKRDRKDAEPKYPDAGTIRSDTGATAMALLCFVGAGHTHESGSFAKDVNKAVQWLLKRQQPDGLIYEREFDGPAPFYSHAQATIALGELFALTGDSELQQPVERAIAYIRAAQNPVSGGWKYRPQQPGGDLSVLGWQVMALQTGRAAGISIAPEVFDGATLFLSQVEEQEGAAYKYDTEPTSKVTLAMTAEGLLCRQYLGWPADHPAMRSGAEVLLKEENLPRWETGRRNVYHWYYATQMFHHLGGDPWKTWQSAVGKAVVTAQESSGSFSPRRPEGHPDERGREGGRLYLTCLSVLILETPYRHRSLYENVSSAPADADASQ